MAEVKLCLGPTLLEKEKKILDLTSKNEELTQKLNQS